MAYSSYAILVKCDSTGWIVSSDSHLHELLFKFLAENDVMCPSDLDDMEYPKDFTGTIKGGKVALLYKVLKEVNKEKLAKAQQHLATDLLPSESLLAMQSCIAAGSTQAINQLRTANTASHVKVNVTERLAATTLSDLSEDLLPAGTLTDWLATEAQKERTKGVITPFIAASIKKWMPHWVPNVAAELKQEEALNDMSDAQLRATQQLAQQLGAAPPKKKKWITHMQWLCGFRMAAQSYNASGMWNFTSILAHEQICMQIAAEAELDNRQFWLAVIYDEMVREKWHDIAYSNRSDFDVNVASTKLDEKVLASAQKEYDATKRPQTLSRHSNRQEAKNSCYLCGETGHMARDCPTGKGGKAAGGKGYKRQHFGNHFGGSKRHRSDH